MALLKLDNVSYVYEGTENGIHDIRFEGEGGDFIAVVGKNGAGKSTLLNLLSGIYRPQSGRIECRPDLNYHDLGISAQKQSIDWYLNVHDNIMLGAVLAGWDKKRAREATRTISEVLDLSDLHKRSPDSLSGGQQQRVQVARALVHDPEIMILDEPTTGLDYRYSCRLFDYLKKKSQKGNKLILVSSHDLAMLEDYCNKILFINEGRQVYFGGMKSFLDSYQLTREITITFAGTISETVQRQLGREGGALAGQTVVLSESGSMNVNNIIGYLLKEVTITGISSERIGLKDILCQEKGDDNV